MLGTMQVLAKANTARDPSHAPGDAAAVNGAALGPAQPQSQPMPSQQLPPDESVD